jgi:hypothetical protein
MDDEAFKTAQREVQRLLGKCMLVIQQYERMTKALVADARIQGSVTTLEHNMAASRASVSGKTLGMVVNELFESVVVPEDAPQRDVDDYPVAGNEIWFAAQYQVVTSAEDHDRTVSDVREIVILRNHLVHHFLEHHDLWTTEGCAKASAELTAAYDQIREHFDRLATMAKSLDKARSMMLAFLQSDVGRDLFVNGTGPDDAVNWPTAGIVSSLQNAEKALGENGWTSVNAAAAWIRQREPEQLPGKYGCSSWPQVLHESRLFDLCKRNMDGQRTTFYRSRSG